MSETFGSPRTKRLLRKTPNRVGPMGTFIHFIRAYGRLWLRHQISMRAAALTYTLILALVPLIAVGVSVVSLLVDVRSVLNEFKLFLFKHLAAGAGTLVGRTIEQSLEKIHFKTVGYLGFLFLALASLVLLSSIEEALNRIWGIQKRKAWWKRFAIYNLILVFGPIALSLSLATTTIVSKFFPHFLFKANLGVILINTMVLSITYKIFPNQKVQWRWALLCGLSAASLLEFAKWFFTSYLAKALLYNKIYGSLAVLPLFLVWIHGNFIIFLSGALLCYLIQNRRRIYEHGGAP
jgi:membrane protein